MLGSAGTEASIAASEAAEAFLDAGVMNVNMLSMQAAECSRVMEALVDPDELSVTTSMADMISDLFNTPHTSNNSLSSSSSNNNNNNNNAAAAAMSAQDLFAVLDLFDAEADAEAVPLAPLIDTESVDTTAVSHEFDLSCVVSKMHRTTSLSPLGRERNETPVMICQNESGGGGGGGIMKRKSSGNPSDFSESETDTTASGSQQQQKRSKTCSSSPSVSVIDGEGGGEGTGHRMTHIAVERNRRKQMNEHLAVLRSLMPGFYVQRGDQASIIGGVIDFIKELQQLLASLESQKQRKAYADALSPRPCSSPRPPVSPRTPPPQLSSSGNRRLPHAVACNSSATSMAEVKELVAHCKSAVADVEVKIAGCNALLKTLSHRIPGQTIRIVSALEQLSLEILHLNISTMDDTVLNSFTLKIGIECKLSVEELAEAVQQTFCSCPC